MRTGLEAQLKKLSNYSQQILALLISVIISEPGQCLLSGPDSLTDTDLHLRFGKVPWSTIHKHELRTWLYWSTFNAPLPPPEYISPSHRVVLDEAVDLIQKRSGTIIPEGSNPVVKPLLLTLDEVKVTLWRPLAWYAGVGISNWLLKKWYEHKWDVRYGNHNGLEYLIRIPPAWNPNTGPRPIVFWHGLGLGLTQYKVLLSDLMRTMPDRPLLVPLQPHISQQVFHSRYLTPMGRHETVECLVGLMEELGWVSKQRKDLDGSETETETEDQISRPIDGRKGITMLSHSK